jgi:uncharacterized membrane protein YhfC
LSTLDPRLIASFIAAIALDVLMPLALVLFLHRQLGVRWKVFGIGALAFAISQLFTRIPLIQVVQYFLRAKIEQSPGAAAAWLTIVVVTAGLFEETARYICFKYPLKNEQNWRSAVALGAGHGGLESALLVGGMALLGLINAIVLTRMDVSHLPSLTPEQVQKILEAKETIARLRWWEPLLGISERICALGIQVALSVLVLQRFTRGSIGWYWLAVAAHAATDALAVLVAKYKGPVVTEITLLPVLALSLWVIFALRPRAASPEPAQ